MSVSRKFNWLGISGWSGVKLFATVSKRENYWGNVYRIINIASMNWIIMTFNLLFCGIDKLLSLLTSQSLLTKYHRY
jgi:hypothetical protein